MVTEKPRSSSFEFYVDNLREIRIDPGQLVGTYKIKNLKVAPINYEKNETYIKRLSENSLSINKYTNDLIEGEINLPKEQMLFLSIPYDKGWELKVDNKMVPTENVNEGFIGAMISKGEHQIELEYHQPMLKIGLIISILCCVTWIMLVITRLFKLKKFF